ncbi:MAG: hypothetical protein COB02_06440 [Candidatus Cloacimonadota bacterium]|nr:MAG: hypothetical protein COB02_06440 [Candidatus Cloacimonadota bacterium]
MSQAYVPSLEVEEKITIRRERRLPLKGDINVEVGAIVSQDTIVASTYLPGKPVPLSAAIKLGVSASELEECMLKKEGDTVKADEIIGLAYSFFGLFKTALVSPIDGTIDSISHMSGQIILRESPVPVEISAYISGKIIEIDDGDSVVIETEASSIQGIFGIGEEKVGEIKIVSKDRGAVLKASDIKEEHKGKILIAGSLMTHEAIKRANEVGVIGIIAGGINDKDLKEILGYDLGVAITGNEKGTTLIVTEGFGEIEMSPKTHALLCKHEGNLASINGATQIRAGVIRPEILIPLSADFQSSASSEEGKSLKIGAEARVIRNPYFGEIGEIIDLPSTPFVIPTGAKVRVATLKLKDGTEYKVPRANIELV